MIRFSSHVLPLNKIWNKTAASIYDTDQFWIIRGIVRPVTSHEAQTDTIINEQFRNKVITILNENFTRELKDCMPESEFRYFFSDMNNFFNNPDSSIYDIVDNVFYYFCQHHECNEEDVEADKEKATQKIERMTEDYNRAMQDPIQYALQELGWIRVNGNNIEVNKPLDNYIKSTIRSAMDEIFGDKATKMNFNIDSMSGYKTLSYDELY